MTGDKEKFERFILTVGNCLGFSLILLATGELAGIQWLYNAGLGALCGIGGWFVGLSLLLRFSRWLEAREASSEEAINDRAKFRPTLEKHVPGK